MGLDMYIYRSTQERIDATTELCKKILKEEKKFESLGVDWSKATDAQLKPPKDLYSQKDLLEPEEVAYWRKVNWLHRYMVDTHGGGVDECQMMPLVKSDIERIKSLVAYLVKILDSDGYLVEQMKVGRDNEKFQDIYQDKPNGRRIKIKWADGNFEQVEQLSNVYWKINAEVASELAETAPTQEGFFFGSTEYDIWYACDVYNTYDKITKLLSEWDNSKKYWYQASW